MTNIKKSKDFNWEKSHTITVLTSIDVLYAVESVDGSTWSIVQAGFGIANNPDEGVKVLHTEKWHEWPF